MRRNPRRHMDRGTLALVPTNEREILTEWQLPAHVTRWGAEATVNFVVQAVDT